MKTTTQIVAAVSAHYGSDRKSAPHFGVSQASFSRWRTGADFPSEERALKMAELLKLDGAYVLAIVRHDKAKSDGARRAWRRVLEQFKDAAMLALMVFGVLTLAGPSWSVAAQCVTRPDRRRRGARRCDGKKVIVKSLPAPAQTTLPQRHWLGGLR